MNDSEARIKKALDYIAENEGEVDQYCCRANLDELKAILLGDTACSRCGMAYADSPSFLCLECNAYKDHQDTKGIE